MQKQFEKASQAYDDAARAAAREGGNIGIGSRRLDAGSNGEYSNSVNKSNLVNDAQKAQNGVIPNSDYDISRLNNTENLNDGTAEHILEGSINGKGKATGFHYEGMPNAKGRIIPGTKTQTDLFGVYEGQVEVNGIRKTANKGISTFFPQNWTPQQVINAVNEAFINKDIIVGTDIYEGFTSEGMRIHMFIDSNGKINSAYPKYTGGMMK